MGVVCVWLVAVSHCLLQQPQQPPLSKSMTGAATQTSAQLESPLSARERRSKQRMQEFLQRKRLQQLAHCKLRHALLRAIRMLRWRRMQSVWTQWMRENSRAPAAVPMLLESSEQPAPSVREASEALISTKKSA